MSRHLIRPRWLALGGLLIAGLLTLSAVDGTLRGSNGETSGTSTGQAPKPGSVKDSSRGVVCLGTADNDQMQIAVYPDNFPPTSYPIRIKEVKKREGDPVKKGEEIAILDDAIPAKMVEKAEAGVAASKAQLGKAKQALDLHKVSIDVQEENVSAKESEIQSKKIAIAQLRREKDKVSGGADRLAEAEEGIKALEAGLRAEKNKLAGLQRIQPTTQVDLARADVTRAEAELELAREVLKQVAYRSPVDGVIHRSSLYDGMVFGPQMRKEPVVIQPTGKLYIRAEVNQEYAHRVSMNQKATVYDYSNTSLVWKGKVTKIGDSFAQKRSNNSNGIELFNSGDDPILEVTIELDKDPKAPVLRQGQRVRINLGTD